jgi:phospholipid/cholesterol/gamma-HCH transport system substrate-binding protein
MTHPVRRLVWSALVTVVLVAGFVGVRDRLRAGGYELTATFDDVGDLVTRHSVQMADVRIGEIAAIELTDDFRAEVTLRIDGDTRVPRGTEALLRTTSLLGEKFVELRLPPGGIGDGPFLEDGDVVRRTSTAPEFESVVETGVELLGAVEGGDLATIVDVGAQGFGGRRKELRSLVEDVSTLSATFAERSRQLVRIVDGLDSATAKLAAGTGDLEQLLDNLAETTTVLAENRDRLVDALAQLSRLARSQNDIIAAHVGEIENQIRQVDDIVAVLAGEQRKVDGLLRWLEQFVLTIPDVIPRDFTNVYGRAILAGSAAD